MPDPTTYTTSYNTKKPLTKPPNWCSMQVNPNPVMPISPKISAVMQKEHEGQTAISVDGKVVAFGRNAMEALKKAKKIMSDIEEKEFAISRTHGKLPH